MSDLSDRLNKLMATAGWDQEGLARKLDTIQPNVSRWVRGGKTKSVDVLAKVEKLEREHGLWTHPAGRIVVMGRVGAGAEIHRDMEQVPLDGLMEIELIIPMPDGCVAYLVEGDSMHPRYKHGDVIVCNERGTDADQVIGWEAAVETVDGRKFLKKVCRTPIPGLFDLESHNAPLMRNVELLSVERVYAIFPESSVRRRIRQAGR
jgi:hypothetical protein